MRKLMLSGLLLLAGAGAGAQELTVQKIMQDPKWIGSSPDGVFWSADSKRVYFTWNPNGAPDDSLYGASVGAPHPEKVGFLEAGLSFEAESGGSYNSKRTQEVFTYKGATFTHWT